MQIDYYFTCASPWSFLGLGPLRDTAKKHDAAIVPHPVDYGTIFPATGGLPLPKRAPERQAYRLMELKRWSAFRDLPLVIQPAQFPVSDALANKALLALHRDGADAEAVLDLAQSFHALLWLEDGNLASLSALAGRANQHGHDGAALLEKAGSPEIAALYEQESRAAIGAGVFGAPTYRLGEELFWGQDRVDFLDRALERRNPA
ncbi:MAG: 2-hydroxychromene-2-carboxylate isomerase [Sneathiellaceae bacterium]